LGAVKILWIPKGAVGRKSLNTSDLYSIHRILNEESSIIMFM